MIEKPEQLTRENQENPRSLTGGAGFAPSGGTSRGAAKGFFDPNVDNAIVTICSPKGKCECNCQAVRKALQEEIDARRLKITIGNTKTACPGRCESGAFIGFPHKGFFYVNVKPENIPEIVQESFINGYTLFPYLSINPERSYRTDVIFEKETGMLAAMEDSVCMVQVAKYFLDFEEGLSCGKCPPCRIGIKRMQESLDRIIAGKGSEKDLEQIDLLCNTMEQTPYCNFALYSTRPVLSALKYFNDEFKAHVSKQECPAGVCNELLEIQKKKARRRKK